MAKSLIILSATAFLVMLFLFAAAMTGFGNSEPDRTHVYCLDSSSEMSSKLREMLSEVSSRQGMSLRDASRHAAEELDRIGATRPSQLLQGAIYDGRSLVAMYSNMGSGDHTFYVSIFDESHKHTSFAASLDAEVRNKFSPRAFQVASGEGFNDQLCENASTS